MPQTVEHLARDRSARSYPFFARLAFPGSASGQNEYASEQLVLSGLGGSSRSVSHKPLMAGSRCSLAYPFWPDAEPGKARRAKKGIRPRCLRVAREMLHV